MSKKYRVTWWIHGAGSIHRGSDIIETEEDLTELEAEGLIETDLGNMLEMSSNSFKKNLPNFYKKHSELQCAARHSAISNWGILNVRNIVLKLKNGKWRTFYE